MAVAPNPSDIFSRAQEEGKRRLDQSLLDLISTGFIAGFTIVFGLVGLAVAEGAVKPQLGSVSRLAGAMMFGFGVVFLIVGRAELFNENFFDPIATVFGKRGWKTLPQILRLWGLTFVLNLVGGGLFVLIFSAEGVLSQQAIDVLKQIAEEIVQRDQWSRLLSAIAGGSLISMLSFMLKGCDSIVSRILMAFIVGFLLALGPFDHVIVTLLHLLFGTLFDVSVGFDSYAAIMVIVTLGNLVGGVGVVALSHAAQAKGAGQSSET